jgi:hypothetical protein
LEIDPADFVRAVEHLRRHGIEVTVRPQQPGYMDTPESVGAYFLDPDANLIELWAPRPSPTPSGSTRDPLTKAPRLRVAPPED